MFKLQIFPEFTFLPIKTKHTLQLVTMKINCWSESRWDVGLVGSLLVQQPACQSAPQGLRVSMLKVHCPH